MARRTSKAKPANTATTANLDKKVVNPRVVVWYADDDKNYATSGRITFTPEALASLQELMERDGAHDEYLDTNTITVPFQLYENDKGSDKAPDESGSLSVMWLLESDD